MTDAMLNTLLSNSLWLLFLLIVGSGWYMWRRRALLSFFQVSKSKRLLVYLSRIEVKRGGSRGVDGVARGFSGVTVTAAEAGAATFLARIFEYIIPGMEQQPALLKTLFTRDISVQVQPCPLSAREVPDDATVVTVGSPGYNTVSKWAQQALNPKVSFSPNNDALVTKGDRSLSDPRTGMVQVLYHSQNDRRVFYVGGIAEEGTRAALLYLALHWRELKAHIGKEKVYAGFVRFSNGRVQLSETIH